MDDFIKNLKPFECENVSVSELRLKWEDYKNEFAYLAKTLPRSKKKKIKSIFLTMAGRQLQRIYENLRGTDSEDTDEDDDDEMPQYVTMIERLDNYFAPKQHDVMERFNFWKMRPGEDEPLNKFLIRATVAANKCQFGDSIKESREVAVCDKILLLAPPQLRKKILETEQADLNKITKLVNAFLTVESNSAKLNESESSKNLNLSSSVSRITPVPSQQYQNQKCMRCGLPAHGAQQTCPARNSKCHLCNRMGHYARKCLSSQKPGFSGGSRYQNNSTFRQPAEKRKIQFTNDHSSKKFKVNAIDSDDDNSKLDDKNFVQAISDNQDELVWFKVGGLVIEMLVDSGSQYNLIDERTWNYLKQNKATMCNVKPSDKKLRAYAQPAHLRILCSFESPLTVAVENDKIPTLKSEFHVVESACQNLLGKRTAMELGILHIGLPNAVAETVHKIENGVETFPCMKNVEVFIEMNENITPVVQRVRRVPIALRQSVEDELNRMHKTGIIETVKGASPWVSALVPVMKNSGEVRICVDMRAVNTAVQRKHHMIPTLDEILADLAGVYFFSLLDVEKAYWQCSLNEKSRHVTTFITHIGMFRFTRLPFGISSAPEIFQSVMEQKLCGIKNAKNFQDDILVWGRTEQEHDIALTRVMKCMKENNVLLNLNKCKFRVSQIVFLGHRLTRNGIEPGNDKVIAIQNLRAPKSLEELRSLLGLISYVGRFIEDLSTKLDPLRMLLKNKELSWEPKHDEILTIVKADVSKPPILGYFCNNRRTRVVADASPVALGAVLMQFTDNTDENPVVICYASKVLTETERKYCQTEKEALAIVWSMERFRFYLLGRKFEVETDHRPLEMIFKPSSRPPGRIERWILRMQAYQYSVVYRSGKNNIADPLSRLCKIDEPGVPFDEDDSDEMWITAVVESVAVDVTEIKTAVESDAELQAVIEALSTNNWSSGEVKAFSPFKDEITEIDGYLIRNSKLIIPLNLRQRILELAHEGHPGEVAMVSRLRDRVWWPGMDREARSVVKKCRGCLLVSRCVPPEPMQRRKMPSEPWVDLALDFLGPLPCGDTLLVIVDYFSRYKEVKVMKRITAQDTIAILEPIFVSLGYPRTITLDQGRQLISKEFATYCEVRKITLNHTTPYWPQANGEVERQNRSLLKRLKISNLYNRDWHQDLLQYLMMYNTTPHSTTGKTPTELLRGKSIRSKIPSARDIEHSIPPMTEHNDRDTQLKHKGKESEDTRRRAESSDITVGDTVVIKDQLPANKLSSTFLDENFTVIGRRGNQVTVRSDETDRVFNRNTSHIKKTQPTQDMSSMLTDSSFCPITSSTPGVSKNDSTLPPCTQDNNATIPDPVTTTCPKRPIREIQRPVWTKDYVE